MIKGSKRKSAGRPAWVDRLESRTLFAFGLTTTSSAYTVDTGGGLVFSVLRGGTVSSTVHLGDLTSAKYAGKEMLATYAQTSRYSHYEQGLTGTAVISATVDPNGQWIKITCDDSAASTGGVIHYYVAKKGDANLYMASLPTDVNNGPGEGRFLAYLSKSVFTNVEEPSNISSNVGAVEGSDVFYNADGTTHSKFYNNGRRMIDNAVHGVTGTGVGAYMNMGNREHSSGGPFFKDIDFQTTSAATEIYNVLFSGHTQTEAFRQGLQGPYALQFTNGTAPATPDYSFLEGVGLSGLVPAAQRGAINGTVSGVPAGHEAVVALANGSAQYWAKADASTGAYSITGVMPGTYAETLYDKEIAVGTRTVTITAGGITRTNLTGTSYTPGATWRIGTWDGTPAGFLNADKIEVMHPSDVRMTSWTTTPNFTVGANTDADWPMAQFMDVNNAQRITFTLTAAQAAVAQTLRIGITLGFEGGRNRITVNSGQTYAWTSAIPAASQDLNSRGITRGTYRGTNQLYAYNIPTSALKAGVNTIDLPVVSGSYVAGQGFLSPNVAYDAIDLVPTANATAPAVTSLTIGTIPPVSPGNTLTLAATARSAANAVLPANVVWTAARGTINDNGEYVAPATAGTDVVTASYNGVTTTATVLVLANAAQRFGYRANDNAATLTDTSGNNLAAAFAGSTAYAAGVEGNAVRLTGGSVTLPNNVVAGLNDFTIGGWVKPDSLATWARVFDIGTGTGAYMFLTPTSNTGGVRFAITTNGNAGEQQLNGPALASGVWTHLAVTLSGNTATLYVNGTAVATNTNTTVHPAALGNTASNFLGKSRFAADPAFLGSLDDLRLYSAGLTAADVNAWYRSAAAPAVTATIVDDGSAQRSRVRSVTLAFDQVVDLDASDLSLLLNDAPADVTLLVTPTSAAKTQYVVTFSGNGATAGSLVDGRYKLLVKGAGVTNANGIAMTGDTTVNFYRLFGDGDGSGRVDFNDFLRLQNAFGTAAGNTNFAAALDGDNNGLIDFNDFLLLQNNFGKSL